VKTTSFCLVSVLVLFGCGSPDSDVTTTSQAPDAAVDATESTPSVVPGAHNLVFAAPTGESYELYTFDLSDPNPQQLTSLGRELGFPVWSPSGDRIAFIAMTEHTADLMVLDTRTGATSILLAGYNELADWDRRGERLLVGLEDGLHFLDVANGSTVPIQTGSTADAYGRCARDTDLIAYESGRDGNPEIYVTHLDKGETIRLTENPDLDEWPSPSRDGERIAWASGTEDDKNLWIMNSDGSDKRQITENLLLGDAFPEWSPDGSQILFTANEADSFVLKLMDVASGEITDLGAGTAPSWR
jgi:Tol biopolymer transport system component